MLPHRLIMTIGLAAAVEATAPTPAAAGRRTTGGESSVTAESRHGNGSVSGAVREGTRGGLEVRLPSGSWTACRRSCSETLRVQTLDFWENQGGLIGAGTIHNECGIFGCLEIGR